MTRSGYLLFLKALTHPAAAKARKNRLAGKHPCQDDKRAASSRHHIHIQERLPPIAFLFPDQLLFRGFRKNRFSLFRARGSISRIKNKAQNDKKSHFFAPFLQLIDEICRQVNKKSPRIAKIRGFCGKTRPGNRKKQQQKEAAGRRRMARGRTLVKVSAPPPPFKGCGGAKAGLRAVRASRRRQ